MKKISTTLLGCAFVLMPASAQNDLLTGQSAGVLVTTPSEDGNPLGGGTIDIRGINTLHGDNQPLYVIDGVVMGSGFSMYDTPFWNYSGSLPAQKSNPIFMLNPKDIKSVKVLKDAAATALYGARGANGVVIITTTDEKAPEDAVTIDADYGTAFNEYLNFKGATGQTIYNYSLSYSGFKDPESGKKQNLTNLKINYKSHSGKVFWYGINFLASLAGTSNPDVFTPDYDDDAVKYSGLVSAYARFNISKNLNWTTSVGADYRGQNRYFWYGSGNSLGERYQGLASISGRSCLAFNGKSELDFGRYFGKSNVGVRMGVEYLGEDSKYDITNGSDFFSFKLRAKGLGLANSAVEIFNYYSNWAHFGAYASAEYSLSDIIFASASVRADRTPLYDDDRFVVYPAASARFDLHNAFFKEAKGISTLRIEGGYGVSGNEQSAPYALFGNFITGAYPQASPEAHPYYDGLFRLTNTAFDFGGTAGFASDRIVVGVKKYHSTSEDTFRIDRTGEIADSKWQYSGRTTEQFRTCTIVNDGIEFELDASVVDRRTFAWKVYANATYGKNMITKLDNLDTRGKEDAPGEWYTANVLGHSVGSIIGYEVGEDGYYKDVVADGMITEADKVILGGTVPEWYGGLGTTVRAGRFHVDVLATWATGFYVVDFDRLRAENRSMLTARYVMTGDFLHLQRVNLAYDIPVKSRKIKGFSANLSYGNTIVRNSLSAGINLKF